MSMPGRGGGGGSAGTSVSGAAGAHHHVSGLLTLVHQGTMAILGMQRQHKNQPLPASPLPTAAAAAVQHPHHPTAPAAAPTTTADTVRFFAALVGSPPEKQLVRTRARTWACG